MPGALRPWSEDRGAVGERPDVPARPPFQGAPRGPWRPDRRSGPPGGRPWGPARGGEPTPRPPLALSDQARVDDGEELVAGRRPVEEAFAARRPARRLLVVPDRRHALQQIVLHATTLRIPVVEVEGGTLTSLAGFDGHQGVALVVEPRRWATIDEVLARARERGEPPFILVLDSLEDPQNMGTMLRSAEACGVHGVIFPTRRSAPISPAAIKASAGAVEHLLLVPLDDLGGGLVDLRTRGLRLVGADESASLAYRDADLRGPLALVVGSEGHGISGPIRRRIDLSVRIPMRGKVGSLNASVAGSVLLFEAAAQRPAAAGAVTALVVVDAAVPLGTVGDPPPPVEVPRAGAEPPLAASGVADPSSPASVAPSAVALAAVDVAVPAGVTAADVSSTTEPTSRPTRGRKAATPTNPSDAPTPTRKRRSTASVAPVGEVPQVAPGAEGDDLLPG